MGLHLQGLGRHVAQRAHLRNARLCRRNCVLKWCQIDSKPYTLRRCSPVHRPAAARARAAPTSTSPRAPAACPRARRRAARWRLSAPRRRRRRAAHAPRARPAASRRSSGAQRATPRGWQAPPPAMPTARPRPQRPSRGRGAHFGRASTSWWRAFEARRRCFDKIGRWKYSTYFEKSKSSNCRVPACATHRSVRMSRAMAAKPYW